MTDSSRTRGRHRVRAAVASAITTAVAAALLVATPAAAAPPNTFSSSFEADDAAPLSRGTGEAVNVSGERFAPASVLPHVTGVTASAENEPNEIVANLADGDPGSKWLVFDDSAWAQYDLGEAQPLARYTLTSGNDADQRDPRDFSVQGSNDGTTWTTLDERSGESFTERGQTRAFDLDETSEPYLHYRLEITANQSGRLVQLADWEPISSLDAVLEPSDLMLEVGSGPRSSSTAKTGVGFTGVQALRYG